VATRYDKRDFVYRGTIDVAAIRIWLRDPRRNTLTGHALVPAANIQLGSCPRRYPPACGVAKGHVIGLRCLSAATPLC
jgi:hypothetical protein